MSTANTKHAYLILAHANPFVLDRLLRLLDDERNDIYIHVDLKAKDFNTDNFVGITRNAKTVFIERMEVYWGHVSQIQVELRLFRSAFESGTYAYYHLISGGDLPLQSQDDIHRFFQKHSGKEFLGFSQATFDKERIDKIHLFSKNMRASEHQYSLRLQRKIRNLFVSLQRILNYHYGVTRGLQFVYGSNWASLSHQFVSDLLAHEEWLLDFYKHSNCGDEIYKQTFAYNTKYRDLIYNIDDELASCQRFMDWNRGKPFTFGRDDFELLMSSERLFARKFEDAVDKDIVEAVYNAISAR